MHYVITIFWLLLWAMPCLVAIMSDSALIVIIGIIWGVLMKLITDAYAPAWLKEKIKEFGSYENAES